MPTPWIRSVQQTGNLTVFPTPQFLSASAWGGVLLTQILDEFNRLASANLFGLRLLRGAAAPSPTGSGANVQIEVTSGDCKFFDHKGDEQHETLPFRPGEVHGRTAKIVVPSARKIGWAFVFVPINPTLGVGQRTVGPGIRMGLALHELLHACGLDADDPGHERPPGNQAPIDGDFFMTDGVVVPGSKPELDKEFYGSKMMPNASGQFSVTGQTVNLVQSIWLFGQF